MKTFGNTGRLLRVDLSSSKIFRETINPGLLSMYLGGKCLGSKILYEEVLPGTDPLDEKNKLIFVAGPLQGTSVPGSGRFAVVFKSPLTGGFGESHGGGTFGTAMKMAGYDAVVIQGKSATPVIVDISANQATIQDASGLWGQDVWQTQKAIKKKAGQA